MKSSGILIILLSQQGYWFGGQPGSIELRWAVKDKPPDAVLVWHVAAGEVHLASGEVALPSGEKPSSVTITAPEVRVRTELRWIFRVVEKETGKNIVQGEKILRVFPATLLDPLKERMADHQLVVCDGVDGLGEVLAEAGVRLRRIAHPSELRLTRTDIILVGSDSLENKPFVQAPLFGQAESGASVMIFAQTRVPTLMGYPLARRSMPLQMEWRSDHPLLAHYGSSDLHSWLAGPPQDLWAILLTGDEPTMRIACPPGEASADVSESAEAYWVTKHVGRGRLVLCQIPMGAWKTDPKSQLLLVNALNYLSTRPEPTPRQVERRDAASHNGESDPTINIAMGGTP